MPPPLMPAPRSTRKKPAVKRAPGGRLYGGTSRVAADKAAGHTQALSRGLAELEALASTDGGATLTALAARLGIPAPTAHRLLATLEAAGYVYAGPQGEWLIGVRAFRVGSAFLSHRNLVVQAFPYLKRLMEESGETANLAVREGGHAVFVEQVQCRELMRMSAKLGARAPLHASGVGKAMLAAMDDRSVGASLGRHGLQQFTPHTLTSRDSLAEDLQRTRTRGYAIDDQEHALGMRCVAATVRDEHGQPWAALSLAGPTTRITGARVSSLGTLVRETAAAMTAALGGMSTR
jgi:IclR family acetate operon transcriptional repressor